MLAAELLGWLTTPRNCPPTLDEVFSLGARLLRVGPQHDARRGFELLRYGAELGHLDCVALLPKCYFCAQGTRADVPLSVYWARYEDEC
jgi:TPR repeat protein